MTGRSLRLVYLSSLSVGNGDVGGEATGNVGENRKPSCRSWDSSSNEPHCWVQLSIHHTHVDWSKDILSKDVHDWSWPNEKNTTQLLRSFTKSIIQVPWIDPHLLCNVSQFFTVDNEQQWSTSDIFQFIWWAMDESGLHRIKGSKYSKMVKTPLLNASV